MNILTFDIEEWFLEKDHLGCRPEKFKEYDYYLSRILEVLDECNIKATFFCVGKMGTDFSNVVRRIAERDHEIGCHSNTHTWLDKISQKEALENTRTAVESLEQCVGKKILSYRAPAFTINGKNKWAFEVLAECGIEYDSSVFPAARDFGGFPNFGQQTPTLISYNDITIKEFPISTVNLFGRNIAYSGGGYFRFFPLWFVNKVMENSDYSMAYFHINDLIPENKGFPSKDSFESYFKEKGTLPNRCKRYIKGNIGTKEACDKLMRLIRCTNFVNLEEAATLINWDSGPKVIL